MDSLESSELLPSPANSSLWINQLLGERAGERDAEQDTGDDGEDGERRHRTLLLNFDNEVGVVTGHEDKGGEEAEFNRLMDDSAERDDGLTMDSPGNTQHYHSYHGNEEGLELGL